MCLLPKILRTPIENLKSSKNVIKNEAEKHWNEMKYVFGLRACKAMWCDAVSRKSTRKIRFVSRSSFYSPRARRKAEQSEISNIPRGPFYCLIASLLESYFVVCAQEQDNWQRKSSQQKNSSNNCRRNSKNSRNVRVCCWFLVRMSKTSKYCFEGHIKEFCIAM